MFCNIEWTDPAVKHLPNGGDESGNVCIVGNIKEGVANKTFAKHFINGRD